MKQMLALMSLALVLLLMITTVMAVGNSKQSQQMAQRAQLISNLRAELRQSQGDVETLTSQLASQHAVAETLRTERNALNTRYMHLMALLKEPVFPETENCFLPTATRRFQQTGNLTGEVWLQAQAIRHLLERTGNTPHAAQAAVSPAPSASSAPLTPALAPPAVEETTGRPIGITPAAATPAPDGKESPTAQSVAPAPSPTPTEAAANAQALQTGIQTGAASSPAPTLSAADVPQIACTSKDQSADQSASAPADAGFADSTHGACAAPAQAASPAHSPTPTEAATNAQIAQAVAQMGAAASEALSRAAVSSTVFIQQLLQWIQKTITRMAELLPPIPAG